MSCMNPTLLHFLQKHEAQIDHSKPLYPISQHCKARLDKACKFLYLQHNHCFDQENSQQALNSKIFQKD